MALISTDEVCIWLYDNLQYSVTENFITRIPQYILIFTCGNLSQITIENETVFAVLTTHSTLARISCLIGLLSRGHTLYLIHMCQTFSHNHQSL